MIFKSKQPVCRLGSARSRTGAILIVILVCIAVATSILIGVAAGSLRTRRQMRNELQMEQTRWLLEAAVIRATSKVNESEDYKGETINVSPSLADRKTATVAIKVVDSTSDLTRVSVTARMIGDGPIGTATQRSQEFNVLRQTH